MTRPLLSALLVLTACGEPPAVLPECDPCAGVSDGKRCPEPPPACEELPLDEQRARAVIVPCGTLAPRCASGGRVLYTGPALLAVPDGVSAEDVCPHLADACWPWTW